MKKHLTILLFVFTSLIFSQEKRNYNIGILLDNKTEEIDPILIHLENQIKAVVGEDATISFPKNSILINNFNLQRAEENYQQLLSNDTNIILAFGVVNNEIISKQKNYQKPTVLFGAVNRDLVNVDLNKKTSGINNYTYLIESESYINDIKKLKELTNFKNLGIIIEQQIVDILPIKETFDKEFQSIDASYTLIPYKTVSDITSKLDGIDAVYLAGGFFLNDDEVTQLSENLIHKKIPSLTNTGIDDVKIGLMATNQSEDNYDQFIRRIALNIESYVSGTNFSDLPVLIEYTPRFTINFNTAQAVDVPIKYSLIADTDFVGGLKNTISEKNYNLLEIIDQVLDKNLSLQSGVKDIELSEQDVRTAKSNYLPTLTASAGGTYVDPDQAEISGGSNPEFSTSGSITLNQTLFSEAANANIAIQKKLQKAQEETFNASQLDAIFDASNVYFNTLILKANAQIQLRNLNLTKKNLQIAQQNFEVGESGKSDMLRFKSEMAQNTQSMVEAINQLEQSFISLNQLLNNPVETEIDIKDAELNKDVFEQYNYDDLTQLLDDPKLREPFIEFLIEEAKRNAPEIKSLGYNLEATDRNIKLSGNGRFLPTVALQGSYNRTFSRSGAGSTALSGGSLLDDNYNVGVNISLPIFNQNSNNINKQVAIIQKEQLEINKENVELGIAANVRNGVLNLINQISNIELSKVSEEAAKESLELTQTSYNSGSVTIIQLIDAQNNYISAQLSRISAVYNYLINALQLERNIGYYFLINSNEENTKFRQRFLEFLNNKN
ncbi:TolC family protein [Aquimarina sp. 2201CG5-10]|uniref:TolC family protein n=1 Tax=Aquimarina callyspongiae TaxID=3098150 RepID=UPI002AB3F389|nr:TolC family protein [Aquimarina sp. 2201CG5-10]MDY8137957.1 TolC family protein [Aquimarina sp. 2201CG5-10]